MEAESSPQGPRGPLPGKGAGEGEVRDGKPTADRPAKQIAEHGDSRTTGQMRPDELKERAPKPKGRSDGKSASKRKP